MRERTPIEEVELGRQAVVALQPIAAKLGGFQRDTAFLSALSASGREDPGDVPRRLRELIERMESSAEDVRAIGAQVDAKVSAHPRFQNVVKSVQGLLETPKRALQTCEQRG